MIDQNIFKKETISFGSKGIVFIGDKMIACKRDNKTDFFPLKIDLPGGAPEEGESPFETFKREIKEELNLDIYEKDVKFSKKYPSLLDDTKPVYFFVVISDTLKEEDILFSDEGLGFMLLSPQDFISLPDAIEKHQQKVKDYLEVNKADITV